MAATDAPAGSSLARGAAVITGATLVSRITGFVRVVVVAAAMGRTFLANTYQTANTVPNVLFELVAAGVLTSIFVPTFVDYLVRDQRDEGWDAANALTSVALVGLVGLTLVAAVAAPAIMRVLTLGVDHPEIRAREIALGTTFLRLFAPQLIFYGAGMIMTGALHAYKRFTMPAVAPIFNNVVVIGVYLTYTWLRDNEDPTITGITAAETWILGAGTTLGVVVMTLCLVPALRRIGWRFSWRFDRSHPAVRRAGRLGIWALGYAGGYQAGLVVVLLLANGVQGGVASYQWAYTFFYVPHALFAAPIFHVLFPAMSEHVARGETDVYRDRLKDGLDMLGFILVPVSAVLLVAAGPIAQLTLRYGAMSVTDAELVGRVIAAFAIGLPAYSAFLVFTRAYYAASDTKTPTVVNALTVALASGAGAALFLGAPPDWAVAGLALGHSIGFAAGTGLLAYLLARRLGVSMRVWWSRALARAVVFGAASLAATAAVAAALPEETRAQALVSAAAAFVVAGLVYGGLMLWARAPELGRALGAIRPRT